MEDRRETLNKFKKEIDDQLLIAFENWAHAKAIRIDNMTFNPKDGWDAIYSLGGTYSGHHQDCKTIALRKTKDGRESCSN